MQSLRDSQNLTKKMLERKAGLAVRGEKLAQQRFFEAVSDVEVKHQEKILMLLFMRSIGSLDPNDNSYSRRIDLLIRLKRDKISLYGQ